MHDNVPYDIFVRDTQPFRWDQPTNSARASLNCLGDIKVGQQVIIICKSKIKPNTNWTGVVYKKFVSKKNYLYQKDRKECATHRILRGVIGGILNKPRMLWCAGGAPRRALH